MLIALNESPLVRYAGRVPRRDETMRTSRLCLHAGGLLLALALATPSAHAQLPTEATEATSPVPVRVRAFEGTVTVQRATGGETAGAELNLPLDAGDRLWTDASGRAELVLADGSLLWIDVLATLDVVSLPRDPDRGEAILRLWNGSAVVSRSTAVGAMTLRIDTADASLRIDAPSRARIDIDEDRKVWLSVYDGEARMTAGGLTERVAAGQRTLVEPGTAPAEAFAFNTAEQDEFDRWQSDRHAALLTTERHVRERGYVPPEIAVHAADLETHGSWFYYDDFDSWAWRPTTVAVSWAPYRNGRWVYGYGGWSWVSASPWGWVTGHYGRWHHLPTWGWVWFPGRVYSTAWVSWGVSGGFVGWSPIGFWGVPLVSVNLWFGGHYGYGRGYHGHYNYPWRGFHPGNGRPGGVAVPRGTVVAGRGYTRGGAHPEPWSFVRSDDLGRRDLDRRVVARDAVRTGTGAGSVQINGPLRPRDPAGLAIGGGRVAVSRDDGPRIGGTGGSRGTTPSPGSGVTIGDRNGAGVRTVVPRPGTGDNGRDSVLSSGPSAPRPGVPAGGPGSPGRSVTIRPRPGDASPPRAVVPRGGDLSRPDPTGGIRTGVPRPGGTNAGVPLAGPGRTGIEVPRAVVRPGGLAGPSSGSASPYRSPVILPRGSGPSPGGTALSRPSVPGLTRPGVPGLSRPPVGSAGRPGGIAAPPRSGGSSVPGIGRPGGAVPRPGSIGAPPRGSSGRGSVGAPPRSGSRPGSGARPPARPRGQGQ